MEYEKFFNLSRSDLIERNPFYKKTPQSVINIHLTATIISVHRNDH